MGALVLTAGLVAEATGGRLIAGSADRVFHTVSTDSRAIEAGALFIALKGERFDGHRFLADAVRLGAAGALVSDAPGAVNGAAVIRVSDTLAALQALARVIRRESGAQVVAITGSVGKTTTKEVTAELLSARYRVFRNHGNLNNHIGLPLSLLELRHGPEIAVVELGMNHAGEIRALVDIAAPDVRVWTNVGDAHIGHFGTREAVAAAKAEILEQASADAVLVANADDPLVMAHARRFEGRTITFGDSGGATIRAVEVTDRGVDGTESIVETPAGRLRLRVPLPGRAQLQNVLAATAVALDFGVPPSAIETHAAAISPVRRRGKITVANGVRVVDDSYNASPSAVRAMLAALAVSRAEGRKVAVLGEMLELGERSRALHEECGAYAAAMRVGMLVVVGGADADGIVDGARAGGLPDDRIHRAADSTAGAALVAGLVRAGDLVLVKGSRGTRMDIIADRLIEEAAH